MSETEEAVHPLKAMKVNQKAIEDEINNFKYDLKESFSACCTNYFTGIETCVDAQHRRHTECSCAKQLFDAAKLLSMTESVSGFAAYDKTVKYKHISDVVGSGHAASEVTIS